MREQYDRGHNHKMLLLQEEEEDGDDTCNGRRKPFELLRESETSMSSADIDLRRLYEGRRMELLD